ncbi:DNA cytosine methyltransferase [Yersinia enterocolitica]|uniref:DNA cytosine methyltransferase n=1 Tax=Yersinia enterocolitica TaxID=630 RepID=UPI0027F35B9C|nr:DNA cytosine methyltransferase [Yersinia enterocolitica]EKN4744696.1 DNA cytosine methyltransferase [Yersinia enterocolitica]EKN4839810.1 DNA cytosine methyltransferase [Yersinia enterocolitica]EKN6271630.1 DNA cytosine methyltransferase [Yersinia enterocolitica]HDL6528886.1 DNA cytosine methyltransferase [Yersinia enterocolitica]
MKKIKVFDFFSGCGGTSQGFTQAGMDVVFGLDFDRDAGESFKLNFPKAKFYTSDIRTLNIDVVNNIVNPLRKKGYPILFSGCAPCQPFSRQNGHKSSKDPRLNLLKEFSRFVENIRPDFVFVENVPGIQKVDAGNGPFIEFVQLLSNLGYSYSYDVLPALWFGVPQTRERLVLIASKVCDAVLPHKTHDGTMNPYTTVRDWIDHLPKIEAGTSHSEVPDHQSAKLTDINIERIRATKEGGGRETWPEHLILPCHLKHKGHTDVYGRLSWDKPASGLTTRCISYSNGRFGHPEQDRAISVREAACLQTFPLEYRFVGNLQSKARQIGNAVPPKMAEAVGKEIIKQMKNKAKQNQYSD